ncbi:hypothetical protein [Sphingosinicella sp. BN140058]|uniref:hypothetical protein n=1 Tax=Sphingosinicella sp. BN140058 TaxID=1892855 RepID=UPI001013643F|nr:hypothetical protein [Sphingosinicella sp. BN140058]QAY77365.1 hypothetical protein ETR14_13265 [Sphingosinicella sp. BN140058]
MNRIIPLGLCLTVALAGCAGGGDRPQSAAGIAGRTLQVTAANGQVSTLSFGSDGGVRASFNGRDVSGRWAMEKQRLCFTWGGSFRECWPYATPIRRGETRSITSDRGNVVKVRG